MSADLTPSENGNGLNTPRKKLAEDTVLSATMEQVIDLGEHVSRTLESISTQQVTLNNYIRLLDNRLKRIEEKQTEHIETHDNHLDEVAEQLTASYRAETTKLHQGADIDQKKTTKRFDALEASFTQLQEKTNPSKTLLEGTLERFGENPPKVGEQVSAGEGMERFVRYKAASFWRLLWGNVILTAMGIVVVCALLLFLATHG